MRMNGTKNLQLNIYSHHDDDRVDMFNFVAL